VPNARYSDEMSTAMTTNTPSYSVMFKVQHPEYYNLFLQILLGIAYKII
jgi:hypothetical protein